MLSWPNLGTRVTVRYRRPAGSDPPLTDAVGHLLAIDPMVRVRTKTGAVVEFAPADVVALRSLTDAPVRTSAIRALEHAVAAARPAAELTWLDGWLLRADPGPALSVNSAIPLDLSARLTALPGIVDWYERRGLTPRLAVPDRLLALPPALVSERTERVLVRDVAASSTQEPQDPPAGATVADAPDGTRWVGLSVPSEALLAWGARCGATRAYLEVVDDDTAGVSLAESLGFRLHHRRRYVTARPGGWDTV
ncbi:GCN5 family acetyltransferase [Mycobacterium rhizamassiliense]|jgi:hypothetical protein|uniref:GCN5 family acetyltransferase n=1 Tax=Mycobacterium rhizamassiliense TaxID=1841860 RepID=A0A2U3NNY5_9MYCO|nr:GNAT family N-acetyltransferase [Mycobacterium rhizamassiliense]SPM33135.1 GCN5 family acetyltransferase [Mycobacterium rhizamassiliense]